MALCEESSMAVCPRCGEISIYYKTDTEKFPCVFCGLNEDIITNIHVRFHYNLPREQKYELEDDIRKRYVLSPENKFYDSMLYNRRADKDYQERLATERLLSGKSTPNPHACPNCGCTSFTPVRKKWSIFSGFRTNQIDMVCNQCGHIKKG